VRAEEAYAEVERITRRRARNFAYGIMVLPRPKRQAIAAIYAFARRVDDLADGELPPPEKRARLVDLADALDREPGEDATLVALADARRRYPIPDAALGALVAGGLQDIDKHRYAAFGELRDYCRLVAGAVGVACLPVYGARGLSGSEPQSPGSGRELAEALGVALQLINILRDVAEDCRLGRVYLPQDELARFGVSEDDLAAGRLTPEWRELASFQALRAREWLGEGLRLLDLLDRRSRLCVATFAGLYARILDGIEARDYDVFDGSLGLSAPAKLRVVGEALLR
jgi:phytoene synthase